MSVLTHTSGQFPVSLQGTIVFTGTVTGNYVVGETVTGSGSFSAKVVKWVAATKSLTVKKIVNTPTGTITGGTSTASATVATVNSVSSGGIAVKTGGWNIRETDHGITRSKTIGSRVLAEVLIGVGGLATERTDFATAPTFTLTGGAWSAATTYSVAAGDKVTFSVISSEKVTIRGAVTYAFAITGKSAATATYAGSSVDGLTHTFSYTVQAADIGGTGFTVTTGNFTVPTRGSINDTAGDSLLAATGTVAVAGTLAAKTGVTISA